MRYDNQNVCKKKLTSTTGASVALALLVFLLCALVGSSIVVAASASSGTLTSTWDSDQETYVLKSAGQYVGEEFEGKVWDSTSANITSGNLSTLYKAMAYDINHGETSKQSIEVQLSGYPNTTVHTVITMDASYNVNITCTKDNSLRVVYVNVPSSTSVADDKTNVTWLSPIVTVQ